MSAPRGGNTRTRTTGPADKTRARSAKATPHPALSGDVAIGTDEPEYQALLAELGSPFDSTASIELLHASDAYYRVKTELAALGRA